MRRESFFLMVQSFFLFVFEKYFIRSLKLKYTLKEDFAKFLVLGLALFVFRYVTDLNAVSYWAFVADSDKVSIPVVELKVPVIPPTLVKASTSSEDWKLFEIVMVAEAIFVSSMSDTVIPGSIMVGVAPSV